MKYLIVGDLHGRYEIAERALNYGIFPVFIGDYLDSFDRSVKDQLNTLEIVLSAVENKKALALMGNHDASYLFSFARCSGFSSKLYCLVNYGGYKERMHESLSYFLRLGNFYLSHAGISQSFLNYRKVTFEEVLFNKELSYLIGKARGGFGIGGYLWCDWNNEFEPVKDINQIVGHTAGKTIRTKEGINSINYCIDCLDFSKENNALLLDTEDLISPITYVTL